MNAKSLLLLAFIGVLLVLPLFAGCVSAQTEQTNYYVTVKPALISDALTYTSVGKNATLSFQALWTYGPDETKSIQNATVIIQISNPDGKVVDMLSENTTSGTFSFNYTSANPETLAFTPTDLITQDGRDWGPRKLIDSANNAYGFTSNPAHVWWDTFHVSMVSHDTGNLGNLAVSVNVTYLLLPEDGLQVGAVHVSKTVNGADVTINGVKAQETQTPGIYSASNSTWLPTAYVKVDVSQEGWTTTHTAFSFTQEANAPIWTYAAVSASVFGLAIILLRFFMSRKTSKQSLLLKHPNYPFYGAVLLIATSLISLYWGIVGVEATLHSFDWILLGALGMVSFACGILGTVTALQKKRQAIAIFALVVPLFMNVVGVKSSLDMYGLANPWLIIVSSLALSIISGYFISNSEKSSKTAAKNQKFKPTPALSRGEGGHARDLFGHGIAYYLLVTLLFSSEFYG